MNYIPVDSWSHIDLLEADATNSFFRARECEVFYSSCAHAYARRDFHETLIPALEHFVTVCRSPEIEVQITEIISFFNHHSGRARRSENLLKVASQLHPRGVELMKLRDLSTFDALRAAYRSSAAKFHPDIGGSVDEMKAINEAYNLFHGLLARRTLEENDSGTTYPGIAVQCEPITSGADYRAALEFVLFGVSVDDLELVAATQWLRELNQERAANVRFATLDAIQELIFVRCAQSLLPDLRQSRMNDLAEEATNIARTLKVPAYWGARPLPSDPRRLVLNHERMATNALRYRLIGQQRFSDVSKRLKRQRACDHQQSTLLSDFVERQKFITCLPTDAQPAETKIPSHVVPAPDLFVDSFDELTNDQQAEYLLAFSHGHNLELIRKYTLARLTSLLQSAILFSEKVDLDRAGEECFLLGMLQRPQINLCGDGVGKAIAFLAGLAPSDRKQRTRLLSQLHEMAEPRSAEVSMSFDLGAFDIEENPESTETKVGRKILRGGRSARNRKSLRPSSDVAEYRGVAEESLPNRDSTFRIAVGTRYCDYVRAPIERLEFAIKTNSLETNAEIKQRSRDSAADRRLLRALEGNSETLIRLLDKSKDAPGRVAEELQPFCELMLTVGSQMHDPGELQLGFWVNNLTIALVRLERWQDVVLWLDRYFQLPEEYRRKLSPSEMESMRNRLVRSRGKC